MNLLGSTAPVVIVSQGTSNPIATYGIGGGSGLSTSAQIEAEETNYDLIEEFTDEAFKEAVIFEIRKRKKCNPALEIEILKSLSGEFLPQTARDTRKIIKKSNGGWKTTGAHLALGLLVTSVGPLKRFRKDVLLGAGYTAVESALDFLAASDAPEEEPKKALNLPSVPRKPTK